MLKIQISEIPFRSRSSTSSNVAFLVYLLSWFAEPGRPCDNGVGLGFRSICLVKRTIDARCLAIRYLNLPSTAFVSLFWL